VTRRSRDAVSAETVAFVRALGAMDPDPALRNPDWLAGHLLRTRFRLLLRLRPLARAILDRGAPGAYGYLIARTRYLDRALLEALSRGLDQLVILGAGHDTRPYRFAEPIGGIPIFEVDLPEPQSRKRARLARYFGSVPAAVTFVTADLTKETWPTALLEAGYDPSRTTLFVLEDVAAFLPSSAVERILAFVAADSGAGSRLVFDYALRSFVERDAVPFGGHGAFAAARWLRAPFLTGADPEQTARALGRHGLEPCSDLGHDELEARFLDGRLPVVGFMRIAEVRRMVSEPRASRLEPSGS